MRKKQKKHLPETHNRQQRESTPEPASADQPQEPSWQDGEQVEVLLARFQESIADIVHKQEEQRRLLFHNAHLIVQNERLRRIVARRFEL